MDLLYGLPQQTTDSMRQSVQNILELAPDRLSCHAYSRRAAAFNHQRAIDAPSLPSLADRLIMFNTVVSQMEEGGYRWVGLDNFVRPQDPLFQAQQEQRLAHNWMGYNEHGSPNLLGFGTSAISEVGGACVHNHRDLREWSSAIDRGELPVRSGVMLEESGRRHRSLVSKLLSNMVISNIDRSMISEMQQRELREMEAQGYIRVEGGSAYVTEEGRYVLHHLCNPTARSDRWVSAL
jgi:oxygen-independent coproporphyrinogen-3 oxidase